MTSVPCPRCGVPVGLHEGRPHIDVSGAVALYCATCTPLDESERAGGSAHNASELADVSPEVVAQVTGARPVRWLVAPVTASLVAAVLLSSWTMSGAGAAATSLDGALPSELSTEIELEQPLTRGPSAHAANDSMPTAPVEAAAASLASHWPMPVWDGVPLDEVYPSLRGWVHPVTNAQEIVPESGGRKFGAVREGIMRAECGGGHCGVDLDGPRGQPMVAAAAGRVVRVEHSEMGRDGRSGRYVRIEHEDGTLTAYMHLDLIAEGLSVGDRVDAGQYIGTLGASGILASAPHCHFTLELPLSDQIHGDHTQTRYIDPSPFLARSRVVSPMTQRDSPARW